MTGNGKSVTIAAVKAILMQNQLSQQRTREDKVLVHTKDVSAGKDVNQPLFPPSGLLTRQFSFPDICSHPDSGVLKESLEFPVDFRRLNNGL